MANETGLDSTGISTSLPNWLRQAALKARYAASKVWKNCLNGIEGDEMVRGKISQAGDRVTFQIFPTLTTNDISTTDGSFTNTEVTLTTVALVIDKWKNVSADLVDIVDAQSVLKWETEFSEAFGKAVSQKQDTDVLALATGLTTNVVGAYDAAFNDAAVLLAQRKLDDLDVPKDERHWVLAPIAHADLLISPRFSEANVTGFSKGVQVGDGRIVGLYGTPVDVSTQVASTSGGRDNVLFHKEAFGVAMQKDYRLEKFARVRYSTTYAGSALYGVKTLRDNHAVLVKSVA